jgi:hypothetical protein
MAAILGTIDEMVEAASMELVLQSSLDEIEATLIARGLDRHLVSRLVLLIPSAFACEHYSAEGVEFPSVFLVGPPGHERERKYAQEPGYLEARRLARRWLDEGRPSLIGRVLDWSAEATAIKEARERGLTPARMSRVHHGDEW